MDGCFIRPGRKKRKNKSQQAARRKRRFMGEKRQRRIRKGILLSACRETSGEWKIAAILGFHRIWRHKVNCPEGTREGPLGGARQIRKKPCVARVSLHSSLAAP